MRKHKISLDKVQKAFNDAIKRRDLGCMVYDFEPCSGAMECSHFFNVGSNPALRFYPGNAYSQCSYHHWKHHNKSERPYVEFMQNTHADDLEFMRVARNKYIKYDDEFKSEIIKLCNADRLDELKILIEEKLK